MKNNNGLVSFCKTAIAQKTGYVYGTIGQACTTDLLNQCASRYPDDNLSGGEMRKVGEKWIGHRVVDCIGLLKYYMMADKYGENPIYNEQYDNSANGAFAHAEINGSMATMPDVAGICLHMNGHFGVYIGNGYVIEARGTVYGVVLTKLKKRPWTAWFKSPWITYIDSSFCDTKNTFTKALGEFYVFKTGSDIRSGNSAIMQRVDSGLLADGFFYTKFLAIGKGGCGFYMRINGVEKRVCVVNVI